MDISVVICTYNRSWHLSNVLKSLASQEISKDPTWEIIVIDNNSTDDSVVVVQNFAKKSPVPVRYFKEQKQGLSHARNRGIKESRGKFVAFTDDDAIAERHWVDALYAGLIEYQCECAGGKIFLRTEKELPGWLDKELWGFLGYHDYGDDEFFFDTDHYPFGGNMVFAKEVFGRIGLFDPNYGRTGDIDFGGEEYELFTRYLKSGGRGIYLPAAIIFHVIGPEKLQKKYFRKLHFRAGEQRALNDNVQYNRTIIGIPYYVFPQFIRSIAKYFMKPTMRMQMNVCWFWGYLKGRMKMYSQHKQLN